MKTEIPVYKFMTPLPVRLNIGDSIRKAEFIMNDMGIRHLPVVNQLKVVGVISYTDVVRVSDIDKDKILAENLMSSPVITIKESQSLNELIYGDATLGNC